MPKKQTEWSRAYNAKAYDRLSITVPKGRKATVESYAKNHGKSVNKLVNDLLKQETGLSDTEWKNGNS